MERRGSFDYIMLETSGLADPGNLAPLFWVDDGLGSSIYLDGIVTLVDAKNISLSLDEKPVEIEGHEDGHGGPHLTIAHLQISHADVIVINKCDSVSPQELANVTERIHSINGLAKIHQTQYSQVPKLESFLLDLHAYDGIDNLDIASQGHSHLDPTISTITLPLPPLTPAALTSLQTWLRSLLWERTLPPSSPVTDTSNPRTLTSPRLDIHRLKGRAFTTTGAQIMVQGVREVFEIVDMEEGGGEMQQRGDNIGKLVLIGRGINGEELERSLRGALEISRG
ncbi:hypothetical protein ABVK25_007265 [Lepraria finkii]|uniref:Uncharacterized protein n=1 Tax=Lepraria finkii TaxID=1340010 RepID=A0ABR4B3C8_9LECA